MAQKKKEVDNSAINENEDFDFETFRQQVVARLMRGEGLTGENGLLKPLIANFVQGALASELDDHLAGETSRGTQSSQW